MSDLARTAGHCWVWVETAWWALCSARCMRERVLVWLIRPVAEHQVYRRGSRSRNLHQKGVSFEERLVDSVGWAVRLPDRQRDLCMFAAGSVGYTAAASAAEMGARSILPTGDGRATFEDWRIVARRLETSKEGRRKVRTGPYLGGRHGKKQAQL